MLLLYQCLCLGGRMLSVWKGKGLFTVCRCRCVGLRVVCAFWLRSFVSSGWCALWGPSAHCNCICYGWRIWGSANASVASRVDLCIECVADVCFVSVAMRLSCYRVA